MTPRAVARTLVRGTLAKLAEWRAWRDPQSLDRPDVQWLLIYTPPNAGSTALARLIASSAHARALLPSHEGAWLLPELTRLPDRMTEQPLVSAARLRAVWLGAVRHERAPVVVEKTPDNMFRWQRIAEALEGMPQTRIVLIRAPLPTIASWVKRYGARVSSEPIARFGITPDTRANRLRLWTRIWLNRAETLAGIPADLTLRYEDLCADPSTFVAALAALVPRLADIDPAAQLRVKDYAQQPLVDLNAAAQAVLSLDDIVVIQTELATRPDLLAAFGYNATETFS